MNPLQLERECRTYAQYLIGQTPTPYVVNRYLDFHLKSAAMTTLTTSKSDRFDQFLESISVRTPFWACLADSYASRFRKDSIVRKKLVLTLALLECTPPSFEVLDRVDTKGTVATFVYLAWRAARYAVTLAASVAVFTPVRLAMVLSWKPRPAVVLER